MCGIYGILAFTQGQKLDAYTLASMGNILAHRGPDDSGEYLDQYIALGQRRLSIIDLETGHQPIPNEDRSIWVACNGEIYNFQSLRGKLISQGHHFRTKSDSEVLLHLYEQHGDDFISHLEGMFAFALWDKQRQRLILGRDALGIKPLYYMAHQGRLIFASEAKAILSLPGISLEVEPAGLSEYLSLGYVPASYSIFKGIKKLPPASYLVTEQKNFQIKRYWQLPNIINTTLSENDWIEALRSDLAYAVKSQMVSDVPLGAFLSGGVDSSGVVAHMARHSDRPVKTYSIGFEDTTGGSYYNELPYAERVSKLYNTDHKEIIVKPDVARLLPKLLWHMDEPIADTAFITTYLVSEFARKDVTVILSGVGGDELFGGYRRYLGEHYAQYYSRLPLWLRRKLLTPLARRLPSDRHSPLLNLSRYARSFVLADEKSFEERYRHYIQVFDRSRRELLLGSNPSDSPDILDQAFSTSEGEDPLRRLFRVDLDTQLPDDLLMLTDKMSMATSLECRVPLLDQRLVELAGCMPSHFKVRGSKLKHVLKKALSDVLPKDILHRKKRGFGAPMGAWIKQELSPLLTSILSRESVQNRGFFDWKTVEETMALHKSNKEDHTDHLLSLMNFEIWSRIYLDGQSPDELGDRFAYEATK